MRDAGTSLLHHVSSVYPGVMGEIPHDHSVTHLLTQCQAAHVKYLKRHFETRPVIPGTRWGFFRQNRRNNCRINPHRISRTIKRVVTQWIQPVVLSNLRADSS